MRINPQSSLYMATKIEGQEQKIGDVFSEAYEFEIPPSQRPYVWGNKQAREFLSDVLDAMDNQGADGELYFLGSIVLVKQPTEAQSNVIDGQQRLITLTILLSVLRDLTTQDEIRLRRLEYVYQRPNVDRGLKEGYRLVVQRCDREFFMKYVQALDATNNLPEPSGLKGSQKRIAENACFFRSQLEVMKEDRRDSLMAFIVQRCYLFVVAMPTIRDLNLRCQCPLRYQIPKDSQQRSDNLSALNATIGVATLREAISFWEQHKDSEDEEFWHSALQERPFLIAQLFHYPIVIVGSKVYVGGKLLNNRCGSVADFLAKNRNTGAAVIIEIKTPRTRLLDREYRQDVFPWSSEVSGAISQVLHYQSSLSRNVVQLRDGVDEHIESDALRGLVIAGNTGEQLNTSAKRRSFERLRESLHGVSVIGFDELFGRAQEMLEILTSPR